MTARKEWETVADVFISYHHDSAEKLVEQIAAALEKAGISCWYAKRDIPPGGDFARYIPPQIDACELFLFLMNEEACQSANVQNELGLAFRRYNKRKNIKFLPLNIGNVQWWDITWVSYYLIHMQCVSFSAQPDAQELNQLTARIAKLLNREPPTETSVDNTDAATTETPVDAATTKTPFDNTDAATTKTPIDNTDAATTKTPVDNTDAATTETPVDNTDAAITKTPVDNTDAATTKTPVDNTDAATTETPVDNTANDISDIDRRILSHFCKPKSPKKVETIGDSSDNAIRENLGLSGLVMEIRDGYAAVFREDGVVVKIQQKCQVGEIIRLKTPDNPFKSIQLKNIQSKKPWVRKAIALIIALLIFSGILTYNTMLACAYVSLDVDETSVELSINRIGRVIAVNPISSDAQALAETLQSGVKNKTVDDAVSYTMEVFKDAGYLDSADGEIIASVTTDNEKRSMGLTQTVAQTVSGNKSYVLKLYLMEASSGDRASALARKVSPGRYLIQSSGTNTLRPRRDTDSSLPVPTPEATPEDNEETTVSE